MKAIDPQAFMEKRNVILNFANLFISLEKTEANDVVEQQCN
jgi:hypothetical protein